MEISTKQILESEAYAKQKAVISREINSGGQNYFADQSVFKKTAEEKGKQATLKAAWLKIMRAKYPDFQKRVWKKTYIQTSDQLKS